MITSQDSAPADTLGARVRLQDDQVRDKKIKANNPELVHMFTVWCPRTTREQLAYALSLYRSAIGKPLKDGELEGDGSMNFMSREGDFAAIVQRVAPELPAHCLRELLASLEWLAKTPTEVGAGILIHHLVETFIRPRVVQLAAAALVERMSGTQPEPRPVDSFWSQAVAEFVQRLAGALRK
jgi:hypothetical protein